jgi:hypothetical protein
MKDKDQKTKDSNPHIGVTIHPHRCAIDLQSQEQELKDLKSKDCKT